jgi:hypothetical protein
LYNKVFYCFIKDRYILVKFKRFYNYLRNLNYFTDNVEFFYCDSSQCYKRDFRDIVINKSISYKIRKLKKTEKTQIDRVFTF